MLVLDIGCRRCVVSENTELDGGSRFLAQDEAAPLFLARFEKELAKIVVPGRDDQAITLSGEILVAGRQTEDKLLSVEGIRRVSVWTEAVKELGGITSLAGPENEIKLVAGPAGAIDPFDVLLYYPLLGDREPGCVESDAVYPQIETMRGRLVWEPEQPDDRGEPRMRVTLIIDNLIDKQIGAVQALTFGPLALVFQRVQAQPFVAKKANSLIACNTPAPPGAGSVIRELGVRFVSLISPIPATLEQLAQEQIDSACKVWWAKCGLKIVPTSLTPGPTIDLANAASLNNYPTGKIAAGQETAVPADAGTDPSSVNIYLADELTGNLATQTTRDSGGITHKCRTSQAFIILDIHKAAANKYLLAHELGHVVGLRHPGPPDPKHECTGAGITEGSFCSVMVPDSPNSIRNTALNLGVVQSAAIPLGPLMTLTNTACGLVPDLEPDANFFFTIADTPYDRGAEPMTLEPPFTNWWSQSDVWNSLLPPLAVAADSLYHDATNNVDSPMFADSHAPNHTEPKRAVTASGTNHLYVRLQTCRDLTNLIQDPNNPLVVQVHLLLAVPGAALDPLLPVPVTTGSNPIIFSSAGTAGTFPIPSPGVPHVGHLTWNVPNLPNTNMGYPQHSCVFAIAVCNQEVTPPALNSILQNPGAHHFLDLAAFVISDNDVAQRNLHIQSITPLSPFLQLAPLISTLAWLEMSNPLKEPAAARLAVDTTGAARLAGLTLEVNDRLMHEIKVGEPATIPLSDALQPGERLTLRFHAGVAPDLREGTTFPIDIGFYLGDQLVSGYQHVLQVAPLSATVAQVLDLLFGALLDVAATCAPDAAGLAERLARIVAEDAERPERALDSLSKLSDGLASLAQRIGPSAAPECRAVRQRLFELAGMLLTRSNTPSSLFVEQIRDLVDRIQEPAGRMARRGLK